MFRFEPRDMQAIAAMQITRGYGVAAFLVLLLTAGAIYQLRYFHFTAEDAWISLKYARNLAEGHGLVTNETGSHEEGFSNLALVLAVAAFMQFGFSDLLVAKAIGIVSVVASAVALVWIMQGGVVRAWRVNSASAGTILVLAAFMFTEATVTWSTAGLETTLYGFFLTLQFVFLVIYLRTGSSRALAALPFACLLAEMTRPEGLLFLGFTAVVTYLISRYFHGLTLRLSLTRTAAVLGISMLLVSVHVAWRLYYFGQPLANPAYVKLAVSIWNPLSARLEYIAGYFADQSWMHEGLFGAGIVAVITRLRSQAVSDTERMRWMVAAIAAGFVAVEAVFVLVAGADYMAHYRFLAPITPETAVVMAYGATALLDWTGLKKEPRKVIVLIVMTISLVYASGAKNSDRPSWYVLSPDYEMVPHEGNERAWNNIREIKSALTSIGSNTYAHSEFGFIPYHLRGVRGIDMMGLNNHIVAKTFASYPIAEASKAARDYVLSNLPGVISTYGYWRDEKGMHTKPSVGWFFAPYLESRFFLVNYDVQFATSEEDDRLLVSVLKPGFEGVSALDGDALAHDDANRDLLMDGFYIEENAHIWSAPHSRVLLTRTKEQEFLRVKGYLPDITRYPSAVFELRVATTKRYVGDHIFGKYLVRQAGLFEFRVPLPEDACDKKHILIDMFGSRFDTQGRDARDLSWVLVSVSLE
jgi:hypothetical protein